MKSKLVKRRLFRKSKKLTVKNVPNHHPKTKKEKKKEELSGALPKRAHACPWR